MSEKEKLEAVVDAALSAARADPVGHDWGAEDPLSLSNESWEYAGGWPSMSMQHDTAKDEVGEFMLGATNTASFNKKIEGTVRYRATIVGAIVIPTIVLGGLIGEYHVTSARISGASGSFLTLEVTVHTHPVTGFNTNTLGHMENTHTIVWPEGIEGHGAFKPFTSAPDIPLSGIQTCSFGATIGHKDAPDNKGNHLIGRSYGVTYTADVNGTTSVDVTGATVSGWYVDSAVPNRGSEDFYGASISAHKLAAASPV